VAVDAQRRSRILDRIRAIPAGTVATYGDIEPPAPRLVGQVLASTDADVPWHRVVRADGSLAKGARQRRLLRSEGVPFRGDRVDFRALRARACDALSWPARDGAAGGSRRHT
jgi:alkylated DNA nucleotide flippase Atl1